MGWENVFHVIRVQQVDLESDKMAENFALPYVTLHRKRGIKVIARSQHAYTARFVCPKTRFMRIFNS